ncbi:MAG: hypothetical protein A3K19_03475 [Lentisphaerae bacterium RIFOXYB12_FULL_65_16]|nr:MAG: hypothetical protein A3K18_01255 [Lentisphaerae bacterium RIFOXYA12_64_32]OGV86628.1 MAG: hypothetical protein A3K19_03475 [Lentisphaerae bacterium RIFOXYB12_FULL_65_16]
MNKSVEKYFAEIGAVRATQAHVAETSFYTALANLLNDIGHELDPKVRCVLQLQNRGAGMPDGGLFTADQLKRRGGAGPAADPFDGQLPSRGVIEAKAPDADIDAVAAGAQVEKYWQLYGLVLVTNFREFLPVGRDAAGKPVRLESFSLAASDKEFWALAAHPHKAAERFGALRQDWPRTPLPRDKAQLLASAALGRQVAALLDSETPVPGVTAGRLPEALKAVAVFARVDGKPANPAAGDFDLTAGWGHAGKGGVTMPGKGRLDDHGDAFDIYLNDIACWRNVPTPVWEYTIGGYQVLKKWLSYREKPLLGRGLTIEEVRYVTEMTRRIAALLALHGDLDKNYAAVQPGGD